MTAMETVVSPLLSLPTVPTPAAGLLLRGLDLAPRTTVPAWVADPDMRASIEDGFIDIPDDLRRCLMTAELTADAKAIRRMREEQGFGMNALASVAGISGAALSRIENGEREPRPETLKKIAHALGCGLTDIATMDAETVEGKAPMTTRSTEVTANVRLLRQIKKVSAQRLADEISRLGFPVTRSMIANYEGGRRNTIPVDYLLLAAEVLDTDPLVLLLGPVQCPTCKGAPPEGFTCNTCGGA